MLHCIVRCYGHIIERLAVEGIEAQYKFAGMDAVSVKPGKTSVVEVDGVKLVTLTMDQGRFLRKLSGKVYLGENCEKILFEQSFRVE